MSGAWYQNGNLRRSLLVTLAPVVVGGAGYLATDLIAVHDRLTTVEQRQQERAPDVLSIAQLRTDTAVLKQGQSDAREDRALIRQDILEFRRAEKEREENAAEHRRRLEGKIDSQSEKLDLLLQKVR